MRDGFSRSRTDLNATRVDLVLTAAIRINRFSDPRNSKHATSVRADLARRAVALGGTVSAEHGLDKRKAHLLRLHSDEHLEPMRAVKRRLDPPRILGRGTIWTTEREHRSVDLLALELRRLRGAPPVLGGTGPFALARYVRV